MGWSTCSVVTNDLDCDIVVSEFELQSLDYIESLTYTLGDVKNPSYSSSYGLNSITPVLLQGLLWNLLILESWYAIKPN